MAGNFWASSHFEQWIFDKAELARMRYEDFKIYTEEEYHKFMIFWANLIQTIAVEGVNTQPKSRMQVIATAIVYFRRFYIRHSFKEVDPFLIACASIFLASKVEEHGQMSMSKMMNTIPGILKRFPNVAFDISTKTTGMYDAEFILVETMDCCLVVYHPYRPLMQMLGDINKDVKDIHDLEAESWKVVNDSLRTDCALLYPPHIIACASIVVGCQFIDKEHLIKNWLCELNIDYEKLMDCVKLLFNMYQLFNAFDEKEQIKMLIDKLPRISVGPNMGQSMHLKKLMGYDDHE